MGRRWLLKYTPLGAEYIPEFCNMLLFSLSEHLRDLACPSPIVLALTDIDNPQEKLAGYLESRIFPGHASALEALSSLRVEWERLNSFLVGGSAPRFHARSRAMTLALHKRVLTFEHGRVVIDSVETVTFFDS